MATLECRTMRLLSEPCIVQASMRPQRMWHSIGFAIYLTKS